MKALIRSVFLVGLSSVASIGVAVLRSKLLAVTLGPAGVGLLAQLYGVQIAVAGIVPLGLQVANLRYIALYRAEDPDRLARFVSTASRMFLWLSIGATVMCLILLRPLALWATSSAEYALMLMPAVFGIPFLVQTTTWLTYLQAGLDIRAYSRAQVITALLSLLVLAPLVLLWGLRGAALHLLLVAFVSWGVARWSAVRAMGPVTRRAIGSAPFDRAAVQSMLRFGWMNLPPFVLDLLWLPLVVRPQIMHACGATQNGIYQVVYAFSIQYLAIPLIAVSAYSFPRISQLRDQGAINQEVNNATRVAVLFSSAAILVMLLTRDVVIRVLYSHRFLGAVALFPVELVGDLLKAVVYAIQLPMMPQERFRARNVMSVVQYTVFAAVFFAVPASQRLQGAIWGYTACWAVALAMMLSYVWRVNGFRFSSANTRLLVSSFAAVGMVAGLTASPAAFADPRIRLAGVAIAAVWVATSITRQEVDQVMDVVRARLQSAGGGVGG